MIRIIPIFILIVLISCSQGQKERSNSEVKGDTTKIEAKASTNSDKKIEVGEDSEKLNSEKADIKIENPISVINRIFTTYNKYQESTDSHANLDSMTIALKQLEGEIVEEDLTLIINVWMYYTVTDYSSRLRTERVLLAHRQKSIEAVKERMKNKESWETDDGAPFSELGYLLKKLEEAKN